MRQVSVKIPVGDEIKRGLLRTCGYLVIAYLCYLVREIWLPLGLAFLLAMVLDPVVDRMEARGWTRSRASAFIFGSFLFISIGLLVLAFPYIAGQIDALQVGFQKYFPDSTSSGFFHSFRRMGLSPWFANAGVAGIENARASIQHSSNWLTDFGLSMVSNAVWVVIVPIVSFYALRDFHLILAKALMLVSTKRRDGVQTAVSDITAVFARYLRGLAIVSVLNGFSTAILLGCLRVPGAIILGIIAGLFYSVPYIGALLTLVVTAAVSFVGGGPNAMLLALGLSVVLHQIIFDQVVTPRVLGGHVGLHPILSIFALLVGNLLLGVIGMVLAVPVAACVQIAVLAVMPKLSQHIEFTYGGGSSGDTVASLEKETKHEHQMSDAATEIHAAVTAAVESIEKQSENSFAPFPHSGSHPAMGTDFNVAPS